MDSEKVGPAFPWANAAMVAASVALSVCLVCGLRRLAGAGDSLGGLFAALPIVAAPAAAVLAILAPYLMVRSGEEWAEKRHAAASLRAESAQRPGQSLLRASGADLDAGATLLRPARRGEETEAQHLLRTASPGSEHGGDGVALEGR